MRFVRLAHAGAVSHYRLSDSATDGAERWSDAPWLPGARGTGEQVTFTRDQVLAPVVPPKVLCVGRNYAAHAKELGNEVPKEPLLFLKPSSSVIGPYGTVLLPPQSQKVEHEAELAVVIGKRATRIGEAEALAHVFGYTVAGDITARDLQRSDGQWSRAKGFDTFCPLGPHIETELDPANLEVSCTVDGQERQRGRTSDMVFAIPKLIAYMSHAMTLEPGDVLLTGTPEGVGPLAHGNALRIAIEGIGALELSVAKLSPE